MDTRAGWNRNPEAGWAAPSPASSRCCSPVFWCCRRCNWSSAFPASCISARRPPAWSTRPAGSATARCCSARSRARPLADGAWTADGANSSLAVSKEYETPTSAFRISEPTRGDGAQVGATPDALLRRGAGRGSGKSELRPLLAGVRSGAPRSRRARRCAATRRWRRSRSRASTHRQLLEHDVRRTSIDSPGSSAALLGLRCCSASPAFSWSGSWCNTTAAAPHRDEPKPSPPGPTTGGCGFPRGTSSATLAETFNRMAEAVGAKTARMTALNRAAVPSPPP